MRCKHPNQHLNCWAKHMVQHYTKRCYSGSDDSRLEAVSLLSGGLFPHHEWGAGVTSLNNKENFSLSHFELRRL